MSIDEVMSGVVPEEIARNPARLTGLWNQLKQANPDLMLDPGAEMEWLALVEKNMVKSGKKIENPSKVMTNFELAQKGINDVSNGLYNGMSDVDARNFRLKLLRLEEEKKKRDFESDFMAGRATSGSAPAGSILNTLL